MQVKPRFESYKVLKQIPLLKDDLGNDMCLTLLEVKLNSNIFEIVESPYTFWTVLGKNQEQYSNKSIAHSHVAFWREKKSFFKDIVEGMLVEEIIDGQHFLFSDIVGVRTIFKISRTTQDAKEA
jgi:hypothetical protein